MTGAVVIRRVEAGDVPAVVTLIDAVLGEFGVAFGEGTDTDLPLFGLPASYDDHGGAFWVATRDGDVVGTIGLFPFHDAETFELRKMYLSPGGRRQGLGKALLDVALDFARARGARRVTLDTIEEMLGAIAFYEKHGFVRDDRYRVGSRCTRGYVRAL
ncbi:MAG: GNAT family N-acetyltransferase [Deltaproteobacteria bacterium]|nr:MAG: GNAT family N-acetyltransferase [Deltaproteobacteria bacterium]